MLVIPRKVGEAIVIGDEITVTIVAIGGDRVRLGIQHPKHVSVHRKEVWEAIHGQTATRGGEPGGLPRGRAH
ncbi:MAG TPA: carbon storage regulator CsrA [Planctomycetaceae bacterium]|nr:carbon storage regulator CsrA [Planctomycetaceae bacterium]HIQ21449.1 carbon storage regulator [Planctomycetota bacterium]